jgi:endonuclease/exonuclease/phosphatase family metal-dependent hydrolase
MRVATWNTEWRAATSADGRVIRERLENIAPDVVCLTETHTDFLANWGGFTVCAADDWGGPTFGTRREVLLWSKTPWSDVDTVGSPDLPPGRFVRAVTDTPLGQVTVLGVVIPYHMSNVRAGTCDRSPWELHRLYLEALPPITSALGPKCVMLGDFNQRIPSKWVPRELRDKLIAGLSGLRVVTDGLLEPLGAAAIDHVALGRELASTRVEAISNVHEGKQISDHFGVWVSVEAAG